jgi:3-dehydrotetronate 4-kinase
LVGDSIAPGVPVMIPLKNKNMRLVLKSGNFGQKDFFLRAVNKTKTDLMQKSSRHDTDNELP